MAVRITLAGRVGIEAADASPGGETPALGRPARVALAYLVSERHRPVTREELADAVWGEDLPRSWEQLLRGIAVKLRGGLASAGLAPADALRVAFGVYQLDLGADVVIDVEAAAGGVESAEAALASGDNAAAGAAATAALTVLRRQFLPGSSGLWVERRQAELRELHLRALEALASAAEAQGLWAVAAEAAEEAVAVEPFRESAHVRLMSAHACAGNRGEALRAYERCRRTLAEELGVDPSPLTEEAYVALLGANSPAWPGPGSAAPTMPLPPLVAEVPGSFLVGRRNESALLQSSFERAGTDGRQVVLIAGEPGIGKTALVGALARDSHRAGARVLYGRCDEEPAAPYQPFTEALAHYVANCPLPELAILAQDCGAQLARLAPGVGRRLPDLPPVTATDPEDDRLRLFEAVTTVLTAASSGTPLVLVLDDLHWAGAGTLRLLRHVVRANAPTALLIVGTFRHTEIGSAHPLSSLLADLRRERGVARIRLEGLDEDEITAFVNAVRSGRTGDDLALARAVHAHTAGNPFFVGELLRHLAETGGVYRRAGHWSYYNDAEGLTVPEGVREVVARRLQRLSANCNDVLLLASVIGADFDLDVLEQVVEGGGPGVLDAVDEAVRSHLVVELGPGRYRFSHAVVRDTIYSGLTTTRRGRLHRRVGESIEAVPHRDEQAAVASLAHHFAEAAAAGCARKAGDYALAAARQALGQAAWEDAVTRLERGLDALEAVDPPDLERRCDLLLLLAEAWIRFFDPARTLRVAARAVEAARAAGSTERFAWAAYRYLQAVGRTRSAERRREVLVALAMGDDALAAPDEVPPSLRARLLAEVAVLRQGQGEDWQAMASEAVELARRSGDLDALGVVLNARCSLLRGSPQGREHLAAADELVAAAPPWGWDGWRNGLSQRAFARLALGDRVGFETDVAACDALGRERGFWWFRWMVAIWRASLALLDGRFGEVEALASQARQVAAVAEFGREFFLRQLFRLRMEQGDSSSALAVATELVGDWAGNPMYRAMAAQAQAELVGVEAGGEELERFVDQGLGPMPPERVPVALACRVEVTMALKGVERARRLYEAFVPYRGQIVIGGMADGCMGAVDRYLGMLAMIMERSDDATAHFDTALALESGIRSPPLLARTQHWYARMLLTRDAAGDAGRATPLLEASLGTAKALGMSKLLSDGRQLVLTATPASG